MSAYRRRRDEIVGKPIEVLNPDLPKNHMKPVWDTLNRGETYVIEVTNMRADGTRFPVEVHSAMFQHKGRPCVVAVARDLSGRHEAELRYRELMEVIDKGIVVQDVEGRLTYCNAAAMRMFGVSEGGNLNRDLRASRFLIVDEHGHALPQEEWPAMRALRTGKTVESTVLGWYDPINLHLTWLSVTSVPQFSPGSDHAAAGAVAVQRRHRTQARQRPVRPRPGACPHRRLGVGTGPRPRLPHRRGVAHPRPGAAAADDGRHVRLPARTRSQAPAAGAGTHFFREWRHFRSRAAGHPRRWPFLLGARDRRIRGRRFRQHQHHRHAAGHHPAQARRGNAARAGTQRSADRVDEPRRDARRAGTSASRIRPRRSWPSCTSTSTASRWSTTCSATAPATSC